MGKFGKLIASFRNKRVVVLGDFILDEYIYGETERISREAPVLILRYNKTTYMAGGGANPVMNIIDLGGAPVPVSVAGGDSHSSILINMLREKGADTSGIIRDSAYSVPVKTRVMAGSVHTVKQQIIRIDRACESPLSKGTEKELVVRLERAARSCGALLVSDYGGGIITDGVIRAINRLAKGGVKVVVDSRYALHKYRHITTATPNETEAGPAVGIEDYGEQAVEKIGRKLMSAVRSKGMIITRGSRGMMVFEKGKISRIAPFGSEEIVDVSGAGDTVSSIVAMSLACGASVRDAAYLANIGGGLVVMKRGVATVSPAELKRALKNG